MVAASGLNFSKSVATGAEFYFDSKTFGEIFS
jgi:hypothetical protein